MITENVPVAIKSSEIEILERKNQVDVSELITYAPKKLKKNY